MILGVPIFKHIMLVSEKTFETVYDGWLQY